MRCIHIPRKHWIAATVLALSCPLAAPAQTTRPAAPEIPVRTERSTIIAAQPAKVWQALHDPLLSDHWQPHDLNVVDLRVGGKLVYGDPENPWIVCDILELEPEKRLTVRMKFEGHPTLRQESPTRVTYTLKPLGPSTRLTVVHDEFEGAPMAARGSASIWDSNLAHLKTLLETGKPLATSWVDLRGPVEGISSDRYNPLGVIEQITLYVSDFDKSRPWFEKVFGLDLAGFAMGWIRFKMTPPAIDVMKAGLNNDARPGQVAFRFRADDVEALYRRLEGEGVEFVKKLTRTKHSIEFSFESADGFRFHVFGPPRVPHVVRKTTTVPAAPER